MFRRTGLMAIATLTTLGATATLAVDDQKTPGSPPSSTARAGQGDRPVFKKLDANKDGQVSKLEFDAAARKMAEKAQAKGKTKGKGKAGARVFDRLDTNNDGALSPAEIEKLKQLRTRKKGGR